MPSVSISEKKVWVDDAPIPLISGEVHYWRLDPNSWRACLERVKEMGLNIVATYACWEFHEVSKGQFDFTGQTDPRRNLLSFLDLATEMGFWIIFRPGPYIYSEWKNNGVPDEAAKYHRLSPEFQTLAQPYIAAVTEATKPYLVTNGGRIILWQADNEIDPWPHLFTEQLGLGRKVGPFHDFLREQYPTIEALNTAWRTSFTAFEYVVAVSEMFPHDPVLMARYNDFRAFIHWYVNQVAVCSVEAYRDLGVDLPIILNTYSGVGTQRWADLEAIGDLAGADIYPSREYLYRPGEQRHILEAMRYASSFSKIPYVAEFEAGIWHDWLGDVGTLTPTHYRLICLTALQAGTAGWNWYMLVNRDNWYQSPINEWGRTKPDLFSAFSQITSLFKTLDPTTLARLTETAVTFDPLQRSTSRPGGELLQAFHDADIDYDFFDLSSSHMIDKKLLFYAGGNWLSRAGQQKLVDYVEQGGHLVLVGTSPQMDEHMQPLNLLNIDQPKGIVGAQGKAHLSIFGDYSVESAWMHIYDHAPGQLIIPHRLPYRQQPSEELKLQFSLQEWQPYIVGYQIGRGQGHITMIGLQPTADLIQAIHGRFGISTVCQSRVAGVTSALFRRDDDYYLIATNDGNESKLAAFTLSDISGTWQLDNLSSGQTQTIHITDSQPLTAMIPRKDGIVLRLSQSHIGDVP